MTRRLLLAIVLLALPAAASAQDEPAKLAAQARHILETNCYQCHGKDGSSEGGLSYVLDVKRMIDRKRVVPKNADKSRIWLRVSSEDADGMPPPQIKQRPNKAELAILKQWIDVGAPDFPEVAVVKEEKRPFLDEMYVYQVMFDHVLKSQETNSARFQRFFTLTHLHNNPKIRDEQLRLYRAGLAKLLNSLSWRKQIVYPQPIDKYGVILALDLRDLDWDLNYAWEKLISFTDGKNPYQGYPYALSHHRYPELPKLNAMAKQVYNYTQTPIPAVRVDWFLAAASLPPLYHELANIPRNAFDLEKLLRVNPALNFRRDTLARAGFIKSGVSNQNRLVERHPGAFGCYWKSYDFKENDGDSNLMRFPLGPLNLFPQGKHPYRDQAFVHAGGELIWALPNGLHAYMLTDDKGERIDAGPADVVRDPSEFAGKNTLILNGLSCMGCHKHGMIEFTDRIRASAGLQGDAKEKVKRLYPEEKVMKRLVDDDELDYLTSFDRVIAPYLRVGPDEKKDIKLFPEPVTALATPYLRNNVGVEEGSRELGFEDPRELVIAIKSNNKLRNQLGLGAWAGGGAIARQQWESAKDTFSSPFQEAALELQRGDPVRFRRPRYDLP
jgi:serine/threonine-protein kinase